MANKTKYMYDKYTSLFTYCKDNGLNYISIVQRINHGADVKKAIEDEKNGVNNRKTLFYNGVPLREYCLKNGISYYTVLTRIARGRSIEDAIEFYDMRFNPDNVEID